MRRFFNTTGPCFPERHYMLPPEERLVGASLDRYVRDQLYWVLHAARQTGKTTFLQSWMRELNASGEAIACYVSVERCQGVEDPARAVAAVCEATRDWADRLGLPGPGPMTAGPESAITATLYSWAEVCAPRPLVVLFDEVDVLADQPMVSFLRQTRDGFAGRGVGKFPVSVALVGMRDLRDYHPGQGRLSGQPRQPIQHQGRLRDARQLQPRGHRTAHRPAHRRHRAAVLRGGVGPYLGADLRPAVAGQRAVRQGGPPRPFGGLQRGGDRRVTDGHVDAAKELIIGSRATHIDALAERLREDRVRRVVQPILVGEADVTLGRSDRDVEFCMDLGLVAWDGSLCIANAIYREVISRHLSQNYQDNIPAPEFPWRTASGALDMDALMREFQDFWAWNSEAWEEKADYTEAFPHLLLMAFLQRVTNGGGSVDREFAAGRGRLDMLVRYGPMRHAIEIKLVHPKTGREATRAKGLEQIARYASSLRADTRHLVIFDRRPEWRAKPWAGRLATESAPCPDGVSAAVIWA